MRKKNSVLLSETSLAASYKSNLHLPYDSAIRLLDIYLSKIITGPQKTFMGILIPTLSSKSRNAFQLVSG